MCRFGLALAAPLLVLVMVEVGLRLVGTGHPTSFLLRTTINGERSLIQNDRFTFSYFGRDLARQPFPFAIPERKAKDCVRIFVMGESAAYGDPQPEFGLARILEALLRGRYPNVRFEVVNTAMTAINSHVIARIARDCRTSEGDFWVVYMGNNEVVGPFGAGTVFGRRGAKVDLVRAVTALKETRTGQLLGDALYELSNPTPQKREWGGMRMFLNNQVRAEAPEMRRVYDNFRRNLGEIIEAGERSGAKVLVGTVGSNVKDSAPFGSLHRPDLGAGELANWESLYKQGLDSYRKGNFREAIPLLEQAAHIDDTYAELQYVWGQCCLELGHDAAAADHLLEARDQDVLRFRADSQLNKIIREVVTGRARGEARLVECEQELARRSPHGLAGKEFFYEHVHLKFEGNYILARAYAEAIAAELAHVRAVRASAEGWPTLEACATRLGWTGWSEREGLLAMAGRVSEAPFSGQWNHEQMVGSMHAQLDKTRGAAMPQALAEAAKACEAAAARSPRDWVLVKELAAIQEAKGDFAGASGSWRRILEQLPNYLDGWQELGRSDAEQHRDTEAAAAFETALRLEPKSVTALTGLAQVRARQEKKDEARMLYARALRIKPYWGPAHLGLGKLLQAGGEKSAAERHFRQALEGRLLTPRSLKALANFCYEQGWYAEACTNLADAVRLEPSDALTRVNLGITLSTLGHSQEAAKEFAEALRLDPNLADAHVRLGLELGRQGKDAEALEHFAQAVQLQPHFIEARLNLGIALVNQHQNEQALGQFREVLRRHPGNPTALKYLERLRPGTAASGRAQEGGP